jgi:hypothetical protein
LVTRPGDQRRFCVERFPQWPMRELKKCFFG